jgi:hypothetical protein
MTNERGQGTTPGNGLEETMERLESAGEAVQQAMNSAQNQGPAMQHTAHAVLQVLKYAERLGIQLGELSDAFTRSQRASSVAYVGGEMAALGDALEQAGPLLAAGPDEIAARFDAARAGVPYLDPAPQTVAGTTHQSALMLPFAEVPRLVAAANTAGLTVIEFATTAILDAIAAIERGKPGSGK